MKRELIIIGVSAIVMAVAAMLYMRRSGKGPRDVYDILKVPQDPEVQEHEA